MILIIQMLVWIPLCMASVEPSTEDRYRESDGPPKTGWAEATKFFTKDHKSVSASVEDDDIDTGGNRLVFLNNAIFVNNNSRDNLGNQGRWGMTLGLEWDKEIFAQGFYIDYAYYQSKNSLTDDKKFAVLGGLTFPRLETQFPLYLRGNLGLGYFTGDFSRSTLTVDYNLYTGFRIFTHSGMLFSLELGSKNYTRLLQQSYLNSFVLNSGLAFVF